jgi:hypothetical protein
VISSPSSAPRNDDGVAAGSALQHAVEQQEQGPSQGLALPQPAVRPQLDTQLHAAMPRRRAEILFALLEQRGESRGDRRILRRPDQAEQAVHPSREATDFAIEGLHRAAQALRSSGRLDTVGVSTQQLEVQGKSVERSPQVVSERRLEPLQQVTPGGGLALGFLTFFHSRDWSRRFR